jgi:hypothetical protein
MLYLLDVFYIEPSGPKSTRIIHRTVVIALMFKTYIMEASMCFSLNMDWRIFVFYPKTEARDNIYYYLPAQVKTQDTFWLP